MRWRLTKPSTATAFPLRLRLHYKAARVGGVLLTPKSGLYSLKVGMSAIGT
tara:strand:- start:1618 stop:1770 length:153 start_codon:yes stop_codon:yes gene_type:complete